MTNRLEKYFTKKNSQEDEFRTIQCCNTAYYGLPHFFLFNFYAFSTSPATAFGNLFSLIIHLNHWRIIKKVHFWIFLKRQKKKETLRFFPYEQNELDGYQPTVLLARSIIYLQHLSFKVVYESFIQLYLMWVFWFQNCYSTGVFLLYYTHSLRS